MTAPPDCSRWPKTGRGTAGNGHTTQGRELGVIADARSAKLDAALEATMLAGPARTWIEAAERARFLLDRFSATPEARDARGQKLFGRAMGDLGRLSKCEEDVR